MLYVVCGMPWTNDEETEAQRDVADFISAFYTEDSLMAFKFFDLSKRNPNKDVYAFINMLYDNDIVIMSSLLDFGLTPRRSLPLLEKMYKTNCTIYIISYSITEPFSTYRDKVYRAYDFNPDQLDKDPKYTRKTKFDPALLEYAAQLRDLEPPVKFKDLTQYTGLGQSTISAYMDRTWRFDHGGSDSRPISEEEIEKIRQIRSQTDTKLYVDP